MKLIPTGRKSDWLVLKVKDRMFIQSPLNFYSGGKKRGISLFQLLFVGVSPAKHVKYKIITIINTIQMANQLFDFLDNAHQSSWSLLMTTGCRFTRY